MGQLHVKYLLIGGGVAASSAAVAIRRIDRDGALLMVGQEPNRPYHRPHLSKDFLLRKLRHSELFTLPQDWFVQNNVDLRTGRRAAHLDTARCGVALDNGQEISYDRLLLATGSLATRLHIPGALMPNLFYVRTLEDVEHLGHAIDKAKAEGLSHDRGRGQVAVIGAGLLGVELSSSLTTMGLAVHLIDSHEYSWHRFAANTAGGYLSRHLQSNGVHLYNNTTAIALKGDGRVQRVELDDGRAISCDFAIAAVGSSPNRELLRNTPLHAEKAVLVNEHCRTADEHIYAAGDCAAVFDPLVGKHRIIDHHDHAIATGTLAGINMARGNAIYNIVNTYTTTAFGVIATVFGEPKLIDRRIIRGFPSSDTPCFAEIGIATDGRGSHVLAIGEDQDLQGLKQLIAGRICVNGNEERLKDLSVNLSEFL